MRTTIELPDELLSKAKSTAALKAISLRQFVIDAIYFKLAPEQRNVRKTPPSIGRADAAPLKREQIDEAMFG